jgi:hypothetical protein
VSAESDEVFQSLRALALDTSGCVDAVGSRRDLAPIEHTIDGWICLSESGEVGLLDNSGYFDTRAAFAVSRTALIGSLAQRVPLATRFLPVTAAAQVCPTCRGRGSVPALPSQLAVRCQCGGLGWITRD